MPFIENKEDALRFFTVAACLAFVFASLMCRDIHWPSLIPVVSLCVPLGKLEREREAKEQEQERK